MDKKSSISVYETRDYGQFKRLKGNRDVKQMEKVKSSIEEIGYIFNPIIVNEKKEVIDGQNRLGALEALGLPVHYYVVEGADIEIARKLNLGRTNWKPIDYVKSYAESGMLPYQLLLKLMLEFDYFTLQECSGIALDQIVFSGWEIKTLTTGEFEITEKDYQRAKETLELMKEVIPALEVIKGSRRLVVTAIAWCFSVKECNQNRLISRLNTLATKIRPAVYPDDLLYDISKIYNQGISSKKAIDFDVEYRICKRKAK